MLEAQHLTMKDEMHFLFKERENLSYSNKAHLKLLNYILLGSIFYLYNAYTLFLKFFEVYMYSRP